MTPNQASARLEADRSNGLANATTTNPQDAVSIAVPPEEDASCTSQKAMSAGKVSTSTASAARPVETDGQREPAAEAEKTEEGKPEKTRSKARIVVILIALSMAVFLAALDITIITTALPTISSHFGSAAGYTWIGSAYMLAAAASVPVWGKFSDIWGRKIILLLANLLFFIGSLIAALSVSIGMLITARGIQGVGGGGLLVLVNIVISDLFSLRSRGAYYGIIGGVWAIASTLGPILGGVFTEKVSWRWCFYINLPLDGAAFLLLLIFLDVHNPRTPLWAGLKAIDWIGCAGVVGGALMLLLGLEFGGVIFPWNSAKVICLIVFGVFTLALFLVNEWKFATWPIVPLKLFRHRSNCAAMMVCFIHGFVFVSSSYFLPLYLQAARGSSPIMSGVYLLPMVLTISIGSMFSGVFIRKTGLYQPPIWIGLAFMTLGFGLFTDIDAHSSWAKIIVYQLVAGFGVGPNFQAPLIAIQSLVEPRNIASATATFQFVRNLATSMSIVVGGVLYQNVMNQYEGKLVSAVGPENAVRLGGANAGANIGVVYSLHPNQRVAAQEIIADSISKLWIMYATFSGVGLLVSLLITKQTLGKDHQEIKTGLQKDQASVHEQPAQAIDPQSAQGVARSGGETETRPEADKEVKV
ncbi:hypothetical protein P152DRAFT_461963 [Eremomyces bilateralis CBS 781.70]|uniref:Efflux pump dotC n=1 Tax=Eremomyces bilateralis CBS 781.70 TaxID=1392243 RepID=A0A6G1FT24_9PEZI|nr:uncharacterized protein P152DRAFT_461963 [Eremomyces bilateralis CBS 781.70]KAF1808913.1 hypothetical protein P152DRAFT_461963 [Eremomyces bilateralis CBS 781.70]